MRKYHSLYATSNSLGATGVLANLSVAYIGARGYLALHCKIDNGADGAPTDTPVGVWELYASADGTNYSKVTAADTELAKIKPNGNNKVEAQAIFEGVPGTCVKVLYVRTSGGGGNSRVKMEAVVDE